MRILDKQEIDKVKALERKKEVDEGLKLAKTVDNLRKVKGEEESNLRKFRDQSLSIVKGEVDGLLTQKNAIQAEITAMEAKRIELEAPVDLTKEWKEVRSLRQELSDRETNLISREVLVQNLEKREVHISEREKQATNYLDEARKSYEKTDSLRSDMESRKKEADGIIKEKLNTLTLQESALVLREQVVDQEKEQIVKDKKELLDQGTSLIARESTVEANTKLLFEREESVKEKEALTQRYLTEAEKNYNTSENLKLETDRLHQESQKAIHTRYVELAEKEREFGYKERDLISERESLENDRKDLEREKLHVASQQTALRQAWQNIKNLNNK